MPISQSRDKPLRSDPKYEEHNKDDQEQHAERDDLQAKAGHELPRAAQGRERSVTFDRGDSRHDEPRGLEKQDGGEKREHREEIDGLVGLDFCLREDKDRDELDDDERDAESKSGQEEARRALEARYERGADGADLTEMRRRGGVDTRTCDERAEDQS